MFFSMKNIIKQFNILLLLLPVVFTANAQDFDKVDNTVKSYPKSFSNTDKIAEQINRDFKRDDEKARAIFSWIAFNVKYDVAAYGVNERPVAFSYKTEEEKIAKQKKFKEDLAEKTLKSKKGVCQGYATLFMVVADKVGLEAEIIPGTSKSHPAHIGKGPGANDHAWNAVKINGEWKLLDPTWGAGTVTGEGFKFKFNDKYFFAHPDVFFLNHFPDDKKWLLTDKTEADFADLPLYYGNYLKGGYEFVNPDGGSYKAQPSKLPFKIKNLKPEDRIAYVFSRDRVFKEVQPIRNGNTAEFEVLLDRASAGHLTIYINEVSVAAYSINR